MEKKKKRKISKDFLERMAYEEQCIVEVKEEKEEKEPTLQEKLKKKLKKSK